MATNDASSGVLNCYVFKSQLQEYAQKVGFATPVYETIKEGPSHEPFFRSTVIVNEVRYDSLPGFYNRKAAEQSAAEIALLELAKVGETNEKISQPVHETGLCKNLLQEYAQKMNHAIPLYECQKAENKGRDALFICTAEIGGIRYIGGSARTKKEAELKAARTALLAIQSLSSELDKTWGNSQLTVIPSKRKGMESNTNSETAAKSLKAKKAQFKAKRQKKVRGNKINGTQNGHMGILQVNTHEQIETMSNIVEGNLNHRFDYTSQNGQQRTTNFFIGHNGTIMNDMFANEEVQMTDYTSQNGQQQQPSKFIEGQNGTKTNDLFAKEAVTKLSGVEQEVRLADNSTMVRGMLQV